MAASYRGIPVYFCVLFFSICFFGKLGNGQVEQCTKVGCSCTRSFACCLQVEENSIPETHVGSALINPDLAQVYTNFSESAVFSVSDTELFSIGPQSGNLTTTKSINREDMEVGNCVRIVVRLDYDGATGSETRLFAIEIIDTNDNAPVISASNISIFETTDSQPYIDCQNQATKTELARLVATDQDDGVNSQVEYSIPDSTIFTIPDPDMLCINNTVPLDRDVPDYQPYSFTLVATDKGNPPLNTTVTVTLHLLDQNDNQPEFPAENISSVREDSQPGQLIHHFEAVDSDFGSNGDVRYSIEPSTVPFSINGTTGELRLTSNLNAEDEASYSLTVFAIDGGGMTGTTDVTINVEDINEPAKFTVDTAEIVVKENTMTESSVRTITVTDIDETEFNQNNTAIITSGDEFFKTVKIGSTDFFVIIQFSEIDRERNSTLELVVRLFEGGNPIFYNQTITIRVIVMDVNDNAPELNRTSFQYVESDTGFHKITSLREHIYDRDEGTNAEIASIELISVFNSSAVDLTYNFSQYNKNLTSGLLLAPPLDREIVGDIITFNINITDNGEPAQSRKSEFTVEIIDLNDNAPIFTSDPYSFTIRENQPNGTILDSIEAFDADKDENGTVIYSILTSNHSKFFTINSNTGIVRSQVEFDREYRASYVIFVQARDNTTEPSYVLSAAATVNINILDENDNKPSFDMIQYIFTIETNKPIDSFVGRVLATDRDEGTNAQIEYKLEPLLKYFEIDSQGDIWLKQLLQTETIFNLSVIACNTVSNNINATADVTIVVAQTTLSQTDIAVISGVSGALVIVFVIIALMVTCCCCCRNKKGKYDMKDQTPHLNNHSDRSDSFKRPILKQVPASASGIQGRGRVQFSDVVRETHYDHQQAVTGDTILRKESTTNFESSDESPLPPGRGPPIHNGNLPSTTLPVVELEMSPGQHVNGINGNGLHSRYEMHHMHHHSPMHLRDDMPDHPALAEYSHSQGTNSTTDEANSYNSEGEEEESTFSDVASNMNTSIPRFQTDDHPPELHRFVPPPSHPPLHPHLHSHTHPSHISSPSHLEQLHAHNLASLAAAAEASYRTSQDEDLTPTHSHNLDHSHSSLSSQTPSSSHPIPGHQMMTRMNPPPVRPIHAHTNGRNFPHPLIMPDAYPRVAMPDIRRFAHESYTASFSDYGDNSTYASTELDEALDFNFEAEPGFCSLTATDYDESEDR